jgi:hypothetical protein
MNAAQYRTMKRLVAKKFNRFVDYAEEFILPMIKPESLKEFQEIIDGLKETQKDMKKPRFQSNEKTWAVHMEDD